MKNMVIESQVKDIALESQVSGNVKSSGNRRDNATSRLSDVSTGRPIAPQVKSTSRKPQASSKPAEVTVDVHKAAEKLNDLVRSLKRNVTFSVDEEAKATVIKIFKTETGELIKQIPSEEILAMSARIRKNIGWLVDKKL